MRHDETSFSADAEEVHQEDAPRRVANVQSTAAPRRRDVRRR